tara:strand:+ start:9935 stop:10396 length:462 start_codon:yes stop_codon:yes gene_type:complete
MTIRMLWGWIMMLTLVQCGAPDQERASADAAVLKDVTVAEFEALIQSLDAPLLLDVRSPEEWAEGHLKGASHKDYWGDDGFDGCMQRIPKGRPVLVYCAGGGRSGLTANELHAMGHQEVYNLKGGITGWQEEGRQVVQGPAVAFEEAKGVDPL